MNGLGTELWQPVKPVLLETSLYVFYPAAIQQATCSSRRAPSGSSARPDERSLPDLHYVSFSLILISVRSLGPRTSSHLVMDSTLSPSRQGANYMQRVPEWEEDEFS